jgi:hypothetical protein
MAETKKQKKKSSKASKPPKRRERRFQPDSMQMGAAAAAAGFVGCATLGVGVYGQWVREWMKQPPLEHAQLIVAGGAVLLGAALWFGDAGGVGVRVGDAGVALEKGSELQRLAWCDMRTIHVDGGRLLVKSDLVTLAIPIAQQKKAVAWILREAALRVPDVLDVKPSAADALPEPKESDGEQIDVEGVQVAGRHCASSHRPIAFEKDARLCPKCAQVYFKDSVPAECVTCEAKLAGAAVAP